MNSDCFSKLEIDAIGEILNISLGASATAVSTMLNARVDILPFYLPDNLFQMIRIMISRRNDRNFQSHR